MKDLSPAEQFYLHRRGFDRSVFAAALAGLVAGGHLITSRSEFGDPLISRGDGTRILRPPEHALIEALGKLPMTVGPINGRRLGAAADALRSALDEAHLGTTLIHRRWPYLFGLAATLLSAAYCLVQAFLVGGLAGWISLGAAALVTILLQMEARSMRSLSGAKLAAGLTIVALFAAFTIIVGPLRAAFIGAPAGLMFAASRMRLLTSRLTPGGRLAARRVSHALRSARALPVAPDRPRPPLRFLRSTPAFSSFAILLEPGAAAADQGAGALADVCQRMNSVCGDPALMNELICAAMNALAVCDRSESAVSADDDDDDGISAWE